MTFPLIGGDTLPIPYIPIWLTGGHTPPKLPFDVAVAEVVGSTSAAGAACQLSSTATGRQLHLAVILRITAGSDIGGVGLTAHALTGAFRAVV